LSKDIDYELVIDFAALSKPWRGCHIYPQCE